MNNQYKWLTLYSSYFYIFELLYEICFCSSSPLSFSLVCLWSDHWVTHPYSIKHTTTCGSRAHKHELISLQGNEEWGEREGRESNSPSLPIHIHLSLGHILAPLPHNEMVIPPHNEETGLGPSAVSEGDETKMGSWELGSRSPSPARKFFQTSSWRLRDNRHIQ